MQNQQKFELLYIKTIIISILCLLDIIFFGKNVKINIINKTTNNEYTNSTKGRIFLCTLYNNEAEFAYIHIWRLYDYIDKFIIVTSNMTYSGLSKNVTFKSFEKDIKPFMDKVDIVYFNNICNRKEYGNTKLIWCIEASQRDYAKNYIEENYNPTENDLLIITDIDEILTREGIKYIIQHPPNNYYFLKGHRYFPYYYHKFDDCDKSVVVRYHKGMKALTKYRAMKNTNSNTFKFKYNPTKPLITHCSYCFKDIEEYRNKLRSYSHQIFNKPPYITNDWIFKSHYCRYKLQSHKKGTDETYEGWKHLIPDDNRLKYLIDRSFMYPLNQTNYTEKDLATLCNNTYNRTLFEPSTKYIPR